MHKVMDPVRIIMSSSSLRSGYQMSRWEGRWTHNQDASCNEDGGCNSNRDISWVASPHDTHNLCDYSSHAEAEQHAAHKELVPSSLVELEDCHISCRSAHEEDEKDRTNWHIDADCWQTTNSCSLR